MAARVGHLNSSEVHMAVPRTSLVQCYPILVTEEPSNSSEKCRIRKTIAARSRLHDPRLKHRHHCQSGHHSTVNKQTLCTATPTPRALRKKLERNSKEKIPNRHPRNQFPRKYAALGRVEIILAL